MSTSDIANLKNLESKIIKQNNKLAKYSYAWQDSDSATVTVNPWYSTLTMIRHSGSSPGWSRQWRLQPPLGGKALETSRRKPHSGITYRSLTALPVLPGRPGTDFGRPAAQTSLCLPARAVTGRAVVKVARAVHGSASSPGLTSEILVFRALFPESRPSIAAAAWQTWTPRWRLVTDS